MFMRVLPNVKITKKQLLSIYDHNCFNYGSEAVLYEIPSLFGSHTLAKIWSSFYCSKDVIQNKFEKLKKLYQLETLKEMNDIQILSTISCGEEIVGYLMNKSAYREIGYHPITRTELLYYLILARQKLKQFEQMGILYGDVSNGNILVYQNDVCFCDLDNVAYQELEIDNMSESLEEFMWNYGAYHYISLDENAVSYMYNLFTLRELCFLEENRLVEEYLETEQIPRELSPGPYKRIREQMRVITPSYEGHYFIDYVKDKYKQKINSHVFELR